MWDYLIIGGGVAGLFSAVRLETRFPHARILILEKNTHLGGRTRMETFHSHKVVTGAGVGRYPKDRLLSQLVAHYQKIEPVESNMSYQFSQPVYTLDYVKKLLKKKTHIQQYRHTQNFAQFFQTFFSREEYQKFCSSNGYTDFEKADIVDTLEDYGFEDNVPGHFIFPVDWNRLVRYLRSLLRHTTIRLRTEMQSYTRQCDTDNSFLVHTDPKTYHARNLVFAGSIEQYPFPLVHQQIGFNPFLRMYTYSSHDADPLHRQKGMTYYDVALQKSIYISPRIRTVSYSDNQKAEAVMRMSQDQIQQLAGYKYEDSVQYFWKRGTHYYRPLDQRFHDRDEFIRYAQHPEPNIFLVGECISKNQGWTEGALESVLAIEHLWV
uniref:FAD dependent oxidoreductase domain-containing protein n=1 Tax=viral metagenome TaxID=1070528 RepID=A0A6C0IGZ2_9ZZZZ